MEFPKRGTWEDRIQTDQIGFRNFAGFTRRGAVRQLKAGDLGGKSGLLPVENAPKIALNPPIGLKPIEYWQALPILGP
jgi:hypothetical protein